MMHQVKIYFGEAVIRALTTNYCQFDGRSSRSEYWWYVLFMIIVGIIAGTPLGLMSSPGSFVSNSVESIIGLIFLLPGLGIAVRRLHDTDRSGWWLLIGLIPLIGQIILIFWFAKASDRTPNTYGPVPNMIE
ncbi:MAG: DUF805 domain-containing protein [Muribaculaceae bacterium]|nr:DUF805 domain-containing protein [Muribaculaceae bacterium]